MTKSLWRDGTLRETRLVVNGLPDAPEAVLPDEVFLGTPGSNVQIVRLIDYDEGDGWAVSCPPDYTTADEYDDFAEAFAHALALVREAVE